MKKVANIIFLIALAVLVLSCTEKTRKENSQMATTFYIGTYTNTQSEGIYTYALHKNGELERIGLAATSENPSFLTKSTDGKYLIAANENEEGTLSSFKIDGDSLHLINLASSGGVHPCFVTANDKGQVLAANYSSGTIGLLQINMKGQLSPILDVQQHSGKGIHPRQDAAHAHSTWFDPDGKIIISVDLGTNELVFSTIDTGTNKLLPATQHSLKMDPGAGPRHLAFYPEKPWIYVVNELTSSVSLVVKDSVYSLKSSFSTLPESFTEENTCADIHISNDGRFLYASNRGHNSIAIFSIGTDGNLTLIGHESTRGEGPRNFALSPDNAFLLVANQLTDKIVSFKRDTNSGKLEYISEIAAPTPVCIFF
ncbi:MAG: lactonase family protein [Flavobacteriaceae bacterium]|nr:lactonase family protein [Flavobacteriaceae bacterium]